MCSPGVALLDRALWLDLDMPFGVFRLADLFSAGRAGGVSVYHVIYCNIRLVAYCM